MRHILSIDGGGIRGLMAAIWLQRLDEAWGQFTEGSPHHGTPVLDRFDLVAGTSTGALIALALVRPGTSLPWADIVRIYTDGGPRIFPRRWYRRGLLEERYSAVPLEMQLSSVLGDSRFGQATRDTLITSYDLGTRRPIVFKSWKPEHGDLLMADIGRATTAAPTYFEPHGPLLVEGLERGLIDGGVFANNPAISAYAEARRRWPDEPIAVVSLGTGTATEPIELEEAKGWGLLQWPKPIIDILFDANVSAVDYYLEQLLGDGYMRAQVELAMASDALDDTSATNLVALERTAVLHWNEHLARGDSSWLVQVLGSLKQSLPAAGTA